MSRKHFRAVASVIADIADLEERRRTCLEMARELRQFNGMFSMSTFVEACGVDLDRRECKSVEKWEYPEDLVEYEDGSRTIGALGRERQKERLTYRELHRQHDLLMALFDRAEKDGPDCGA